MDIASRLNARVPSVKFVDMTRLLDEDTKTAIRESQNRAVTLDELHERSHLKKLIKSAHGSNTRAFVIHNSELMKHHPSWVSCVDKRRAFDSGVPWCLLYKDDFFMPNPTMDATKAIDAAVNTLFHKDICCICLEELITAESTLLVRCNHSVHLHCMREWGGTCPLCRA
tara:strand:- start:468 stop:974 length:507 start_codon:yes stop_codon:yes gene_type:complete